MVSARSLTNRATQRPAVAALLDFAAIAVEDQKVEVRVGNRRGKHRQQLVETDPGAAIAPGPNAFAIQVGVLRDQVNHHEVVAEAMHLREPKIHQTIIRVQTHFPWVAGL